MAVIFLGYYLIYQAQLSSIIDEVSNLLYKGKEKLFCEDKP